MKREKVIGYEPYCYHCKKTVGSRCPITGFISDSAAREQARQWGFAHTSFQSSIPHSNGQGAEYFEAHVTQPKAVLG